MDLGHTVHPTTTIIRGMRLTMLLFCHVTSVCVWTQEVRSYSIIKL